ncbi:hypothetical protein JOE23_001397 [Amphibacillus cookii]|nr:hypothetical protein [Amphibacillus cookii]
MRKYFDKKIISDYAVELVERGNDDPFIIDLAWEFNSSRLQQILFELKNKYFNNLEEDNDEFILEERKLRLIHLSKLKETIKSEDELLKKNCRVLR